SGYFAIAPEVYARQGDNSKMSDGQQIMREIVAKVPDAQVNSDLDAAVAFAKSSGKADTAKLAITGFLGRARRLALCRAQPQPQSGCLVVRGRPPGRRVDAEEPGRCRGGSEMSGARALRRRRSVHYAGSCREAAGGVQGGRQNLREQGLSGHAARLLRRLPAELSRRTGQGGLGQDARLVQGAWRRLSHRAARRPRRVLMVRRHPRKSGFRGTR